MNNTLPFLRSIVDEKDVDRLIEIFSRILMRDKRYQPNYLLTGYGFDNKTYFLQDLLQKTIGVDNISYTSLSGMKQSKSKKYMGYKLLNITNIDKKDFKKLENSKCFNFDNHPGLFIFVSDETPDINKTYWKNWEIIDFPFEKEAIFGTGFDDKDFSSYLNLALNKMINLIKQEKQ